MSKELRVLDIRDLMRDCIVKHSWSTAEAARAIHMETSALHRVLEGSGSLSPTAFNRMVRQWGVEKDPPLLQRWLVAFLTDKLGHEGPEWVHKAGWTLVSVNDKPVEGTLGGVLFEPYKVLGVGGQQARRRLTVLRAVASAGASGCTSSELCSAAHDTRTVVNLDIRYLSEKLYIEGQLESVVLTHPMLGDARKAQRKARVKRWRITPAGKVLVKKMEGLPGLQVVDSES